MTDDRLTPFAVLLAARRARAYRQLPGERHPPVPPLSGPVYEMECRVTREDLDALTYAGFEIVRRTTDGEGYG